MNNQIKMEIKVPNKTSYLATVGKIGESMVNQLTKYHGDRDALAYQMNMVLTEALVNAIKHANSADPEKEVLIKITLSEQELSIKVYDSGKGFDLQSIPSPTFNSNSLNDTGRGIFIIRSLMDSVEYKKADGGNVLEMKKRLTG